MSSGDKGVSMAYSLSSLCSIRKPGVLSMLWLSPTFQRINFFLGGVYLFKGEYAAHLQALQKCDSQAAKTLYESTWKKKQGDEAQVSAAHRINRHPLKYLAVHKKTAILGEQRKTEETEQVR